MVTPALPAPARPTLVGSVLQGLFAADQAPRATTPLPARFRHLTGGGQPLPDDLRVALEFFFGADLASVRVRVGAEAPTLGTLAFTLGEHIFFAPGLFPLRSPRGVQLLGHEIAHVLQQRAGRVGSPFPDAAALVHDEALEDEADLLGAGLRTWLLFGCPAELLPPRAPHTAAPRVAPMALQCNRDLYNKLNKISTEIQGEDRVRLAERQGMRDAASAFSVLAHGMLVAGSLNEDALKKAGDLKTKMDAMSDTYVKARVKYLKDQRLPEIKALFLKSAVETKHKVAQASIAKAEGEIAGFNPASPLNGAQVVQSWNTLTKRIDDKAAIVEGLLAKALVPLITKAAVAGQQTGRANVEKHAIAELQRAAGLNKAKGNFDSAWTGVAGRSGYAAGVNHQHIGGNASENLIYATGPRVVLGAVDFHIDGKISKVDKKHVNDIEGRSTAQGDTFLAFIDNNGALREVV